MSATFFKTSTAFRAWMSKNHAKVPELLVGFHKVDSGRQSITYQEALDAALAFGWIDGVRRRIDEFSYSIRFTPRRARSVWSNVNIKRVGELIAAGRMAPPGLDAFERREAKRSGIYSYESTVPPSAEAFGERESATFSANRKAWAFFEAQAPYYKKLMVRWTMSAKLEETRERRLAQLIDYSKRGERIPLLGPGTEKNAAAKGR
jgi:uncharacterized protein YdeI (YjbR/CyaY-like superfamily)